MIGANNLLEIFDILIKNESFCKLVSFGEDAFQREEELVERLNHANEMKKIIAFTPQHPTLLQDQNTIRVCLYKGSAKIEYRDIANIQDLVFIDLYVPLKLVQTDLRIYLIENKIINLLDNQSIGTLGELSLVESYCEKIPKVQGYATMSITFKKSNGRTNYGRNR